MTYFRRERFPMAPNQTPKWHLKLTSRQGLWGALCGYRHQFDWVLGEEPLQRASIKTASMRCKDCDQAVLRIKEKAAEKGAEL